MTALRPLYGLTFEPLTDMNQRAHRGGGTETVEVSSGEGLVEDQYEAHLKNLYVAYREPSAAKIAELAGNLEKTGFAELAQQVDEVLAGYFEADIVIFAAPPVFGPAGGMIGEVESAGVASRVASLVARMVGMPFSAIVPWLASFTAETGLAAGLGVSTLAGAAGLTLAAIAAAAATGALVGTVMQKTNFLYIDSLTRNLFNLFSDDEPVFKRTIEGIAGRISALPEKSKGDPKIFAHEISMIKRQIQLIASAGDLNPESRKPVADLKSAMDEFDKTLGTEISGLVEEYQHPQEATRQKKAPAGQMSTAEALAKQIAALTRDGDFYAAKNPARREEIINILTGAQSDTLLIWFRNSYKSHVEMDDAQLQDVKIKVDDLAKQIKGI